MLPTRDIRVMRGFATFVCKRKEEKKTRRKRKRGKEEMERGRGNITKPVGVRYQLSFVEYDQEATE